MKKSITIILCLMTLLTVSCAKQEAVSSQPGPQAEAEAETAYAIPQPTLLVDKVEGLSDDFIMGCDVSSLVSLENSGVKFYGFDGIQKDMLAVLAQSGVNWVRVRVWNNPFDAQGNGYGGGNCDIATAAQIGKRAASYGMKLLLDLHYSDFWADPSKQQVPKAWAELSFDAKVQAIYDYTYACLSFLKEQDALPSMVQIGNETTSGFCGETSLPRVYKLMASASKAIRDFASDILIAVHYTNPESKNYSLTAAQLNVNNVDYDVFASSYYPYWHGTLENLKQKLLAVAEQYGKKVMVAETSWAYTLDDTDSHGNTIGEDPGYDKPYPFTIQGQAHEISDVIKTVSSIGEAGLGVFYWEPGWISVPGGTWEEHSALWEKHGSGWASSYSAEYDPSDAGKYYGGSACDNQALFDSSGHPLESLLTFSYVKTGTSVDIRPDSIEPAYVTVKQNNPITLPSTVTAVYNDLSIKETAVVWDADEEVLKSISASETGNYSVKGTAGGSPVTCYIAIVEENYIENYSFEDADRSMYKVTAPAPGGQTDFQVKSTDAYTGTTSLHFWNEDAVEFRVEQTVTGLREGNYKFSIVAQGGDFNDDAVLEIYAIADGATYTSDFALTGWRAFVFPVINGISCASGEITVGVYIKAAGGAWGTLDDFLLNPDN